MARWYVGAALLFLMIIVFILGIVYFLTEKNKVNKFFCAIFLLGYGFVISGMSCNLLVTFNNNYKMPVLGGGEDERHCSLTETSKCILLADVFSFKTNKLIIFYSIGDALILSSLVTIVLFLAGMIIFLSWQKRKEKVHYAGKLKCKN